jgi:hypothetical protein
MQKDNKILNLLKPYLPSLLFSIAILGLLSLFLITREYLQPTQIARLDWRDNLFTPSRTFLILQGLYELLWFFIPYIILVITPVFYLWSAKRSPENAFLQKILLLECIILILVTSPLLQTVLKIPSRIADITVLFGYISILLITGIGLFLYSKKDNSEIVKPLFNYFLLAVPMMVVLLGLNFVLTGNYVFNLRNSENAKVVRLVAASANFEEDKNLKIDTQIDSDQAVTLWGGIQYCVYANEQFVRCEFDYQSNPPKSIQKGPNSFSYALNLNQEEFKKLKTSEIKLAITYSGQDRSIVTHAKTLPRN